MSRFLAGAFFFQGKNTLRFEEILGEATSSQVLKITSNWSFLEHDGGGHGSNRSGGSHGSGGKKCGSEPQSTRAGGQDDGS